MSPTPTILLVDDDPDVLSAVSFSLRADGYAVLACADCAAAMQSAAGKAPDCMVIDQRLPEMSGLALAAQLRRGGSRAPLILITTHPDRRCRREAERADAVIVEKPLLGDALGRQIRRLLETA